MIEVDDDSWVREFDVSNPQKTHAGYTVYRVSSKVFTNLYFMVYSMHVYFSSLFVQKCSPNIKLM
jgi:hypothetical protein